MKKMHALFGAAALAAIFASPAAAEYVRLGNVDVGFRADRDTAYTEFGGRLESLRFVASRSDIFCRAIVVQYDNGQRQNVFSGRLNERMPVNVDLAGRARRISSIDFACRSNEFRGGKIFIEGDVGRWRDEWRHDRNWDRLWSGLFGGGMGGHDDMRGPGGMMGGPGGMRGPDGSMGGPGGMRDHGGPMGGPGGMRGPGGPGNFVSLGNMSFEGRNDRESTFTGFAARHVERLAFRPLETDAQCGSIVATFENGQKTKLADGRVLRRGEMNFYDLPGNRRNLTKVYMRCRAMGGWRVTIEVFANR